MTSSPQSQRTSWIKIFNMCPTTPTTTTSPAKVTPQIDLSAVSFNPFYRYSKDPQPIELNVDILKKQLIFPQLSVCN
ncbi:hypothetical protein PPL_11631 [Heterostelium album PN500]|uniref:Uncharacterized protein n=1 Tax=Heterostelium pallidum (strain ATCC 26659 / Pp 5 / PN500) TaxID=670386 RepID=D3BVA5_HETP5|nr:hypothetical protein PPL_11631 [Heterostelium album PN500]EFA74662.1 hypothetical protein PPL_11631 [Heterostelium album PN500]|eukprot:XP_020426796.1 hypothetical protein PPL_11631 [Heterostelium album PN500]